MVEIVDNRNCTLLSGMPVAGSIILVAVAYGRASFGVLWRKDALESHWQNLVAVRFVDSARQPTQVHPSNSNGSPAGITGVQIPDGRVLALMAS